MKAIMLAAGMGSRLGKYTKNNTKCMLEVQGKTLLERAVEALEQSGIKDLIIVLGYKKDNVKKYIKEKEIDKKINITYIDNDMYDKTNNIYSLYLAKDYLANDDIILLESDLIYDYSIVKKLIASNLENAAVIARYEKWMDGTVVTLGKDNVISSFIEKQDFNYEYVDSYYKTVNIYKFSKEFSNKFYIPFLESYIKAYGDNEYYELVLKVITGLKEAKLHGIVLEGEDWYEIDDCQDLDIAQTIFAKSSSEKLNLFHQRYGGYWRFNSIKDYCYLVNPYFPPRKMIQKMKYSFEELLFNYPSGQKIETICASRIFNNVSEENLLIGNGAAELINTLKNIVKGKIALPIPSFNEYVRCFPNNDFYFIETKMTDYKLDMSKIIDSIDKCDCLALICPDNPTGSSLKYEEVIKVLDYAKENNKQIVFDESFMDFADKNYTLIDDDILNKYPNLIVIKSISKSYGVPGLRLGILATSNKEYIKIVKDNLPVWNINSFGEYFLQIYPLYKKDYELACIKIKEERNRFYNKLKNISELVIYPSDANYFMCKLNSGTADELAEYLLTKGKILIKVLNGKNGFDNGEYIRIAIKDKEGNDYLFNMMESYYKK